MNLQNTFFSVFIHFTIYNKFLRQTRSPDDQFSNQQSLFSLKKLREKGKAFNNWSSEGTGESLGYRKRLMALYINHFPTSHPLDASGPSEDSYSTSLIWHGFCCNLVRVKQRDDNTQKKIRLPMSKGGISTQIYMGAQGNQQDVGIKS